MGASMTQIDTSTAAIAKLMDGVWRQATRLTNGM